MHSSTPQFIRLLKRYKAEEGIAPPVVNLSVLPLLFNECENCDVEWTSQRATSVSLQIISNAEPPPPPPEPPCADDVLDTFTSAERSLVGYSGEIGATWNTYTVFPLTGWWSPIGNGPQDYRLDGNGNLTALIYQPSRIAPTGGIGLNGDYQIEIDFRYTLYPSAFRFGYHASDAGFFLFNLDILYYGPGHPNNTVNTTSAWVPDGTGSQLLGNYIDPTFSPDVTHTLQVRVTRETKHIFLDGVYQTTFFKDHGPDPGDFFLTILDAEPNPEHLNGGDKFWVEGVRITKCGTLVGPTLEALASGVAGTIPALKETCVAYYSIEVPPGATQIDVTATVGAGDIDLYARLGDYPTWNSNDANVWNGTTAETMTISSPAAGTWYFMVESWDMNTTAGSITVTVT